jgi:hypothetical protein
VNEWEVEDGGVSERHADSSVLTRFIGRQYHGWLVPHALSCNACV